MLRRAGRARQRARDSGAVAIARTVVADLSTAVTAEGIIPAPKDQAALVARLMELGYSAACGRCGGSGSYGPLSVQGGQCFTCRGGGLVSPRLDRKLLARVRAEVTPERLAALVAERQRRAAAKKLAAGAEERARAAYSRTLYMRHHYGDDGRGIERADVKFSPLGHAIHDGERPHRDALLDATISAKLGRPVSADRILELEAALVRARQAQDLAFAVAFASGAIERSARWSEALWAAHYDQTITGAECLALEKTEREATRALAGELLAAAEAEIDAT